MKDERPLDHEDAGNAPKEKRKVIFIIAASIILVATLGAFVSSLRMIGIL